MEASMAEKAHDGEEIQKEMERLKEEIEQLRNGCKHQKMRTMELLKPIIDGQMKKLVNSEEKNISMEQNKIDELTKTIEKQDKDLSRLRALLITVPANKKLNALNRALNYCNTQMDVAHQQEIQSRDEIIEGMRSEREREMGAMVASIAEKVNEGEKLKKEVERLEEELGKLRTVCENQKLRTMELLKPIIDGQMKKLVNSEEKNISMEQNKIDELTKTVEKQDKELARLRALLITVPASKKHNALNRALNYCNTQIDEAHQQEIQNRNEIIEGMRSERERAMGVMETSMAEKVNEGEKLKREVERLEEELGKLRTVCENQKLRTMELLKPIIDGQMKKLVNSEEKNISMEQNKIDELTKTVEKQDKELARLRALLITVPASKKHNALNRALNYCNTQIDEAHQQEIQNRNEIIEGMRSERERAMGVMETSMAEKVNEGEKLKREVERLEEELGKLRTVCENQKLRTMELLKPIIDGQMKKLVNIEEKNINMEQKKIDELTKTVEKQDRELSRLRDLLNTVPANKKHNALNRALNYCNTQIDVAHQQEIQSRDEIIKRMRAEREREMAAIEASMAEKVNEGQKLKSEVKRLEEELGKLRNVCGALSDDNTNLTKFASEWHSFIDGFKMDFGNMIKMDFGNMIKAANTILGVKQEEEPATADCEETLQQFYMKYKEVLSCFANSKSEVENQNKTIAELNGTIARNHAENTKIQNELNKERSDRERVLKWIDIVNHWLKHGEKRTKLEDRVSSSNQDMIERMRYLLFYSGFNPESTYKRPQQLQEQFTTNRNN